MSDNIRKASEPDFERSETKFPTNQSPEEMAMEQVQLAREQVQLAKDQLREARRGRAIALVFGLLGLLAAIIAIYLSYLGIANQVGALDRRVESVETSVLASKLIVVAPSEGANVQITEPVRVKTPFLELNHYLVITPLKTADDWVQDNPTKPDQTGTWVGNGRFGTGDTGTEERFIIRVLATKTSVPPGKLKAVPVDAIYSAAITVVRQK